MIDWLVSKTRSIPWYWRLIVGTAIAVLFFQMVPPSIAEAQIQGTVCKTVGPIPGGTTATICAAVNNHDLRHWNEALGTMSSNGDVKLDYLKLYRSGVVQVKNNQDRWVQGPMFCWPAPAVPPCWYESTDWEQQSCTQASGWKAVFGIRLRGANSTGTGYAFSVSSEVVTLPTC